MVKASRYLHVGPGGQNCVCCFPAPRSKDRRKRWRSAKRKADREAIKNALVDLVDDHWMELEELNAEYEKAYGPYGSPFDDWSDYWQEDPYKEEEFEDDYTVDEYFFSCYDDDIGYFDDEYYHQSEQEKVARALAVMWFGHDASWREHLNEAKRFMEAMKRNGS